MRPRMGNIAMKTDKIKLGFIGGGANSFIGIAHRIAAYSGERYQLTGGVWGSNFEQGKEFARQLGLDAARTYANIDALSKGKTVFHRQSASKWWRYLPPTAFITQWQSNWSPPVFILSAKSR